MKEQPEEIRAAIERVAVGRRNPANGIGTRGAAGDFVLCARARLPLTDRQS